MTGPPWEEVRRYLAVKHGSEVDERLRGRYEAGQAEHGTNQHAEGGGYAVTSTPVKRGNDPAYIVARLKRDGRDQLAADVIAGRVTPHHASLAAGYRRRYIRVPAGDPEGTIRALIRGGYTPDQIAAALQELGRGVGVTA